MWPDRYDMLSPLSYYTPCLCTLMVCYSQSVPSFKQLWSTSKYYEKGNHKIAYKQAQNKIMTQSTVFLSFKKCRFKIFCRDQSEKRAEYTLATHNANVAVYTR